MYDIVLSLAALIFIAITMWYVRSEYFSVFHPFTLYLAFDGFLFVFRPILAWVQKFSFVYQLYEFVPSDSDKITAIAVSTLGLLSFAFFCFRRGNVPMRFNIDGIAVQERQALLTPFFLASAFCFPLGFYSLITSWNQANSDTLLTAQAIDKVTRIMVNVSQNGYLTDAQLMLASCGAILAWLFRFRLWAVLPLATFLVLRAGTGGRGPFVAGAIAMCLLWLYDRRKKLPPPGAALGLVLLVVAFTTVGMDRGRTIRQWLGNDQAAEKQYGRSMDLRPLEGMDFANLEYLEYVIYTVPEKTHTYSYFAEELQLFTEGIPRQLWVNKPVGSPVQMFNLFDYGNPIGMTVSVPGMGWAGAGWLGVIFWCGLWGYILGALYRAYADGPQTAFQTAAYMAFMSSLVVGFRDGGLVSVMRQNMFFLAPVWLWLFFADKMGIPSASRMRQILAKRARNRNEGAVPDAGNQAAPAPTPATGRVRPAPRWLPPAVARRRAALAAAPKAPE